MALHETYIDGKVQHFGSEVDTRIYFEKTGWEPYRPSERTVGAVTRWVKGEKSTGVSVVANGVCRMIQGTCACGYP